MSMYKTILILLLSVFVFSCNDDQSNECACLVSVNKNLLLKNEQLYNSLERFNGNLNLRETHIQEDVYAIKESFKSLRSSIHKSLDNKAVSGEVYSVIANADYDLIKNPRTYEFEIDSTFMVVKADLEEILKDRSQDCKELTNYRINLLEEHLLINLYSQLNKNRYTFNKVEPFPYSPTSEMKYGDSIELSLFYTAYDSTKIPEIRYWIDDASKNKENGIVHKGYHKIKLGGDKGAHIIYGDIEINEDGQSTTKQWEFGYMVK
jgi:hypothetical protein